VLTLDTYNGSRAAAESYRQITGVTAPMLQNASNGTDYAGARLEDILVVDQTGIVRYWTNATSDVDYPRINQMVDALVESEQAIFPFLLKDRETGTVWNLRGEAIRGKHNRKQLAQVPATNAFWFAWATFWQNTGVY